MTICEKVGERIRKARESSQLTSTELAKEIGMSRQLITNWEKGRRLPTLESIISLADTLNAPVTYLLGINDSLDAPMERKFSLKDLDEFYSCSDVENISIPIQFIEINCEYIVVRMKDDSMEPLLRKHDLAIIQLEQAIHDGNFVLFKINKTNQTLFRKYIIDNSKPAEPQIKLVALNQAFPEIQYDPEAVTILGICRDNLRMIG